MRILRDTIMVNTTPYTLAQTAECTPHQERAPVKTPALGDYAQRRGSLTVARAPLCGALLVGEAVRV